MPSPSELILANGAAVRAHDWAEPEWVFAPHAGEPYAIWLDSADPHHPDSRYSFIATAPRTHYQTLEPATARRQIIDLENALTAGRDIWRDLPSEWDARLPPFRGGLLGVFSYDLGNLFETLPAAVPPYAEDDQHFPLLSLGVYDTVIAFDRQEKTVWIISNGLPGKTAAARRRHSEATLARWQKRLATAAPPAETTATKAEWIAGNFTPDQYRKQIESIIDHILKGDIFQANLSQRFTFRLTATDNDFTFYRRLRNQCAAPFAAFCQYGNWSVASASPERFLHIRDNRVDSKPIKGTCPRGKTDEEDAALSRALLASDKDRAENIMIVDLLRNDLARVCEDDSIEVPALCALESFSNVHHLVSQVRGHLRQGVGPFEVLKASFPGGSITGAPKIRAMELIASHEPTRRGPYCGGIGYIGFDGVTDINIAIRTALCRHRQISFQVGGGITAASQPDKEYRETLDKAAGLLTALGWQNAPPALP